METKQMEKKRMEAEMAPVQMSEKIKRQIIREGGRSYLLLPEDASAEELEEWEQFAALDIGGLLSCQWCCRDGNRYLSYDITGKQSLSDYYKEREICFEDCRSLLMSMDRLFRQMYECLLSEENLQISPEMIYIGMEEKEVRLVYGRNGQEGFSTQIKGFAEYVLEHIDYRDDRAVTLAHQFYKYASAESFNMGEFLSENRAHLNPGEKESEPETTQGTEDTGEDVYEAEERYYELWISKPKEQENEDKDSAVSRNKEEKRGNLFWLLSVIPLLLIGICWLWMARVRIWLTAVGAAYVVAVVLYQINHCQRNALEKKEEVYYMENRGMVNPPVEN